VKRIVWIVLGILAIIATISLYRLYMNSSPTPDEAVSQYITRITKNTPQKMESVDVISSTYSDREDNEQTLLFRANQRDSQTHFAGYALVRSGPFGWYVRKLQMVGTSSLPEDVLVDLDQSDGSPIIYGQVFLESATGVEAIFNDPNKGNVTISAEIPNDNFVLFGSPYSELVIFKILDANGDVINQFTSDEMQNK